FLMDFARDLLAQAKGMRRRDLVASSKVYLDKVRGTEDKKVSQALEKLGGDWSGGPAAGPPAQLQLQLQPLGDGKLVAGTIAKIRGIVQNVGTVPAPRLAAGLETRHPVFGA